MAYGKIKADAIIYDNSGSDVEKTIASLAAAAPTASPTFTGTVTVPTASANDNTTKAASTAYVQTELGDYATLAAPALTGTATAVNLTLSGNLTVNGTTTTVATTNTTIADNLIELNSGASSNANDSGILIERGSTGDNAIIAWDESADKFVVGTTTGTASSTGDITIATGTLVANVEGAVTGTASGNAVLTGSTNNQIVTVTGANAIQGEAKLTFDGATLDFAINNSSQGIKIGATGNHIPEFKFDANRTQAGDNLGQTKYFWNGTEVARISGLSGADTTNKDDGTLLFYTRTSGSSLATALTLDTSQNATFTGSVSDSKGDLRKIIQNTQGSAYTLVAADSGKHILATANVTIPNNVFAAGDAVTIVNNSGSDITLTASVGGLYNSADGATGNRTLAGRGMATILFVSGTGAYISGAALS